MLLCAGMAAGQPASTSPGPVYPSKPIRIVTGAAGSGVDFASRLIATGIAPSLGQPVFVDNRTSGIILGETVARAPADGYTLLLTGSTFWVGSLLEKPPYDVIRDFAPITWVTSAANVLVVHPSLPVKSAKDLIALAKARPDELNYALSGMGGPPHLATELFKSMAGGLSIMQINYKCLGNAVNALIAGEIQMMISTAPAVIPSIKSGKLRALGVTSAQPSVIVPGLPPIADSGLPGFEHITIMAMFAPAKTPAAIINQLNREIVRFLRTPDAKERFLNSGVETVGSSPEEFATKVKSEMTKWGKIIKDANIRVD